MTDTQTTQFTIDEENDSQVLQWYKKLMNKVSEIDEKVDAGSEAAGMRKFRNDLVTEFEHEWKPVTDKLLPEFAELDDRARAGALYGILRALSSVYKEPVDKWIQMEVESQPKPETTDTLSDDEKKALMKERQELVKQVKTIVDMAETFGEFSGPAPEPGSNQPWALPRRRGAIGSRGKRALSLYTWTVDGEEMPEDEDSNAGVSQKLGFEKVSEFTQALKDAGIKTTSPDPEFSVTINGHVITATRVEEDEENGEETVVTEAVAE